MSNFCCRHNPHNRKCASDKSETGSLQMLLQRCLLNILCCQGLSITACVETFSRQYALGSLVGEANGRGSCSSEDKLARSGGNAGVGMPSNGSLTPGTIQLCSDSEAPLPARWCCCLLTSQPHRPRGSLTALPCLGSHTCPDTGVCQPINSYSSLDIC